MTDYVSLRESKEQDKKQDFKQDNAYRKALAKGLMGEYQGEFSDIAIDKLAENLKAIMGAEELRHVLTNELQPENFLHGKDYQNVIDGTYRANLHMHTRHSDGELSPKELLDQVETYAKYRKTLEKTDSVIVGITDHDTLNGAKEAVKVIAMNPENYRNIRFVPGIEFCTFYIENDGENDKRKPFEAPGYAVNPFKNSAANSYVGRFVEGIQAKNAAYLEQIVMRGPDKEGQPGVPDDITGGLHQWEAAAGIPEAQRTSVIEIRSSAKLLKSLGSPGFMMWLRVALLNTFEKRDWSYDSCDKKNGINIFIRRHKANYGSMNINPGTPDIKDIAAVVNASGQGFVGISHPCRDFQGYDLKELFLQFKAMGVEAAEVNYIYRDSDGVSEDFDAHARLIAGLTGLLKVGGNDNHSKIIFGGRGDEDKYLPKAVRDILK